MGPRRWNGVGGQGCGGRMLCLAPWGGAVPSLGQRPFWPLRAGSEVPPPSYLSPCTLKAASASSIPAGLTFSVCLSVFVFCLHWPFCLHESFRFNRSYNLLGFLSDGASVAGPSRCPIKRWQGQSSTVWSRGPTVGAVITTGSWLRDSRKCRSWIMLWLRRWIRLCR